MQWSSILLSTLVPFALSYTPLKDAEAELQIRNRLSLYSISIDKDDFAQLDQVFTPDVTINYNVPGVGTLNGLPAVKQYLTKVLTGFNTQHTISTTLVDKGAGGKNGPDAVSTAYLVAFYFG